MASCRSHYTPDLDNDCQTGGREQLLLVPISRPTFSPVDQATLTLLSVGARVRTVMCGENERAVASELRNDSRLEPSQLDFGRLTLWWLNTIDSNLQVVWWMELEVQAVVDVGVSGRPISMLFHYYVEDKWTAELQELQDVLRIVDE